MPGCRMAPGDLLWLREWLATHSAGRRGRICHNRYHTAVTPAQAANRLVIKYSIPRSVAWRKTSGLWHRVRGHSRGWLCPV
jgi:hypothetical protein